MKDWALFLLQTASSNSVKCFVIKNFLLPLTEIVNRFLGFCILTKINLSHSLWKISGIVKEAKLVLTFIHQLEKNGLFKTVIISQLTQTQYVLSTIQCYPRRTKIAIILLGHIAVILLNFWTIGRASKSWV